MKIKRVIEIEESDYKYICGVVKGITDRNGQTPIDWEVIAHSTPYDDNRMIDLDKEIGLYKSKVAFYESQNTRGEYAVTVRELKFVVETLEALRSVKPKGEWISNEEYIKRKFNGNYQGSCFKSPVNCDQCGYSPEDNMPNFCPNCGADMRKGD